MLRSMTVALAMLGLCFVGCEKESDMGGPGASTPNNSTTQDADREDNTFTIKVPNGVTIIQGANKEAVVSIDRGEVFKQAVAVEFTAPAGVTVTPASETITADKDELTVLISVEDNATIGETNIQVTGTPETGKAVSVQLPVKIEAKQDNG